VPARGIGAAIAKSHNGYGSNVMVPDTNQEKGRDIFARIKSKKEDFSHNKIPSAG
jgi:hypothetical protein